MATDRARFVGEPVAVIVSERPEAGADAAELIWIDQTDLPVVLDLEEANRDEVLLHPAAGTNTAFDLAAGHTDDLFDNCEVVVRQRIHNQRLAGCPMEPRGGAAAWTDDGRIVLWASTQHVQDIQGALAGIYGMEPSAVRVIAPDVGGGFGPKIGAHPEELLLPWIARAIGRPVRWHETRTENMLAMGHGRGQLQDVELGGKRDGTIEAYRITVAAESGAYCELGAFLPALTRMMASGVYDIPKVEANARALVTNTNTTRAYRGAGRPEAAAAIERTVDLFAAEIGMDPADVRRANLPPADAFPFTTAVGTTYDSGDYARALDLVLDSAGYSDLLAEQARRREAGDRWAFGIGLSTYVEITAGTPVMDEYARIEADDDGGFTIYTGTSPHGQGHATTFAMIASEELGVPVDQFRLVHGDTDIVSYGGGTMGSRSLQIGGPAVQKVAIDLVEAARKRAADVLEADPDDVVLDKPEGKFHVTGTPAVSLTWPEVASGGPRGGRAARRRREVRGERDVPSRSAPTYRWSRSTPRRGRSTCCATWPSTTPAGRQPAAPRRSAPRRHRSGHRAGAVRGVRLRLVGHAAHLDVCRLPDPGGVGAAVVRADADGDTDAVEPVRRQGHRRGGHHRVDAGGAERGVQRRCPSRRPPHRHAPHPRAGLARPSRTPSA